VTSVTQPQAFATRATPKKLGPPPRHSKNARDEYFRQLDYLAAKGDLAPRTRDFLHVTTYHFSDAKASDYFPSQATLAELHGCSRRTVQRRIAVARSSGVLKVAQLKGYNPVVGAWFCSSNTHRPTFVPEWVDQLKASRAAKREEARKNRIGNRAQRPKERAAATPQDYDPAEEADRARDRLAPSDVKARAQSLRELILPTAGAPPGA
jgi:helix-turn-helix protein